MKVKIYLAKSNKANPDDVMRVRQLLSKYPIEIVEYSGGTYSNKPLKDCQFLIIVPCMENVEENWGEITVTIGKGLHDQITYFESLNNGCEINNILVLSDTSDGDLTFSFYEDMDVCDSENYIDYTTLMLSEKSFQLKDFFSSKYCNSIEMTGNGDGEFNKYKYLLILK